MAGCWAPRRERGWGLMARARASPKPGRALGPWAATPGRLAGAPAGFQAPRKKEPVEAPAKQGAGRALLLKVGSGRSLGASFPPRQGHGQRAQAAAAFPWKAAGGHGALPPHRGLTEEPEVSACKAACGLAGASGHGSGLRRGLTARGALLLRVENGRGLPSLLPASGSRCAEQVQLTME